MSNTKSREFLLIWDSTMSNPNGDMLNENRPRQDEVTGQLEVSDVRVKRFAREEWINKGENVLVQTVEEKGKIQTCQKRVETIQKSAKIKDDDIEKYLTDNYILSYGSGVKLIELKDIVWIYPFITRQRGIVTNKSIYVITNDKKTNVIALVNAMSKKSKAAFDELYQNIINRVPDVLVGYSKENKELVKERYKN